MTKRKSTMRTKASNKPLHHRKAVSAPYSKVKSRTFQLKRNTILAFLHPKYMTQDEFSQFINDVAADVLKRFGISTIVVGVEHWSEMRLLDEGDMNKNGWYHRDQILALKDDLTLSDYSPKEIEEFVNTFVPGFDTKIMPSMEEEE